MSSDKTIDFDGYPIEDDMEWLISTKGDGSATVRLLRFGAGEYEHFGRKVEILASAYSLSLSHSIAVAYHDWGNPDAKLTAEDFKKAGIWKDELTDSWRGDFQDVIRDNT